MTTHSLSKPVKLRSKETVSVVISTFLTLPKKSVIRTFWGSRWKRSVRCPGVETHKLFGQTWNWKQRWKVISCPSLIDSFYRYFPKWSYHKIKTIPYINLVQPLILVQAPQPKRKSDWNKTLKSINRKP